MSIFAGSGNGFIKCHVGGAPGPEAGCFFAGVWMIGNGANGGNRLGRLAAGR